MAYTHSTWRLILHEPGQGAWNMAVDEILLRSMVPGTRPILRLYGWDPACLSLGYAQNYADIDPIALSQFGWEVVRRPTGGRAILHTDELTYSVIAPYGEPRIEGGVLESYQRLSKALLAALQLLDLPVQAQLSKKNSSRNGPVCFDVPSNYEITLVGKKIIGSAQARKKEGVLQHGTLPLSGDLSRITKVLKYESTTDRQSAAEMLHQHATTLSTFLLQDISWERTANAIIQGFQTALSLEFSEEPLNHRELEASHQMVVEKYGTQSWTQRV